MTYLNFFLSTYELSFIAAPPQARLGQTLVVKKLSFFDISTSIKSRTNLTLVGFWLRNSSVQIWNGACFLNHLEIDLIHRPSFLTDYDESFAASWFINKSKRAMFPLQKTRNLCFHIKTNTHLIEKKFLRKQNRENQSQPFLWNHSTFYLRKTTFFSTLAVDTFFPKNGFFFLKTAKMSFFGSNWVFWWLYQTEFFLTICISTGA